MEGFLVYGWLGGAAYLTLIAVSLIIGLRAALISTPWQPYLIATYAVFGGEIVEGMVVDTRINVDRCPHARARGGADCSAL